MLHDPLLRQIGTTDLHASAVGLGTWAIGGWMWGGTDEAESIAAIETSIGEGISLIDTAPAYGQGVAESIVGKAIKGKRDKVVLATKCGLVWHTQQGNHFFDVDGLPVHRHLGRQSIMHEIEQSLTRLGTDYIDLYITHWQDPTTPIDETMDALHELKAQGKIRAIGASNVSSSELDAYIDAGTLDAMQEEYSMIKRDIEQTLLPTCVKNDVSVLSYSSLAQGLLSGKIGPDRVFAGDDLRRDNPRFSQANREKIAGLTRDIAGIASAYEATMAQIIIAWTLQQAGITFSLCGARNAAQAKENARAGRIRLSHSELKTISEAALTHLSTLDS